jgi:hypothetical protein
MVELEREAYEDYICELGMDDAEWAAENDVDWDEVVDQRFQVIQSSGHPQRVTRQLITIRTTAKTTNHHPGHPSRLVWSPSDRPGYIYTHIVIYLHIIIYIDRYEYFQDSSKEI